MIRRRGLRRPPHGRSHAHVAVPVPGADARRLVQVHSPSAAARQARGPPPYALSRRPKQRRRSIAQHLCSANPDESQHRFRSGVGCDGRARLRDSEPSSRAARERRSAPRASSGDREPPTTCDCTEPMHCRSAAIRRIATVSPSELRSRARRLDRPDIASVGPRPGCGRGDASPPGSPTGFCSPPRAGDRRAPTSRVRGQGGGSDQTRRKCSVGQHSSADCVVMTVDDTPDHVNVGGGLAGAGPRTHHQPRFRGTAGGSRTAWRGRPRCAWTRWQPPGSQRAGARVRRDSRRGPSRRRTRRRPRCGMPRSR